MKRIIICDGKEKHTSVKGIVLKDRTCIPVS